MTFLSDFRSGSTVAPPPERPRVDPVAVAEQPSPPPPAASVEAFSPGLPVAEIPWTSPALGATSPPPPPPWPPSGGQYWAPPQPPAAPAPRRRGRGLVVVAAVALAAIVGAGAVFVQAKHSGPPYPASWDQRVSPIAQFVQSQRGLTWKHPVKVEFLAPGAFDTLMAKDNSPDPTSRRDASAMFETMRAMGLASGNVDLAKAMQQFAQSDVVGQYVDQDRTVYVRGDSLTPYVRSVLAHELTHALQAQYFDLEKMASGHADDDSAVTALIEGDAVRVQNAYEQSLSESDQNLLQQEQEQASGQANGQNAKDGIPQFLIDQSMFPYDFGPTFVAALVADGGNKRVDAAFRDPPTLDASIVDPEGYTPGLPAPTIGTPPVPKGAHQVMAPSGFGQVALVEMLGDQIGFGQAWPAVQGWMQDRFVSYSQRGRVCASLAVLNDGTSSATSLAQAGRAWAAHLPSASVRQSGATVDFSACDPGGAWKPSTQTDDPYQALSVRSVLMYQLISDGHLSPAKAACAGDELMTTMGPQELQNAEQSSDPNSPAIRALSDALRGAVSACD